MARYALGLAWRADARRTAGVLVLQAVQAVGLGGALLAGREVLQGVTGAQQAGTPARMAVLMGVLLALGFAGGVLSLTTGALEAVLRLKVERDAMEQVVRSAAAADLAAFEDPGFHDRVERAVEAAHGHAPVLLMILVSALRMLLGLTAVAASLAVMAWWLPLLLAPAVLPAVRVAVSRQRAHYTLVVDLTENRRMRGYLTRLLTGRPEAKEIRAFGLASHLIARLSHCYQQALTREQALQHRYLRLGIAARVAADFLAAAAVVTVAAATTTGHLPAATALTALGGLYIGAQQTTTASAITAMTGTSIRYLQALHDFTTPPPAPPQPSPPIPAPPGQAKNSPSHHTAITTHPRPTEPAASAGPAGSGRAFAVLEADHVSFTYPAAARPALTDVSLRIYAGEVVALVGENGSGKTTLAKLLTGLYQPTRGHILLNGQPAPPAALQAASAVLFQDYLHYSFTAAENIALGDPARLADHDAITHAARRAGAHPHITALRHSYNTQLGTEFTHGTDLSIGQWQRIALARALFRNAPLIVLDEPTAALDPHAETRLLTHTRELFTTHTLLLITHRLTAIQHADRICVLHHGRITEQGTHHQLLAHGGHYTSLYHTKPPHPHNTPTPAKPPSA
ncbi:ABC transporter ATP-binding protein [Streptomyces sp. NBC_00354]|uniref:ABC transporter ATP-binding protein n=1 Tax=Streptomyces sp. NBC_00354 TaxID=2975723 RepID=UPI002E265205